jgi:hypothetical protein
MIQLANHAPAASPGWRRPTPAARLNALLPRRRSGGRTWPFLSRPLPPAAAAEARRARAESGS